MRVGTNKFAFVYMGPELDLGMQRNPYALSCLAQLPGTGLVSSLRLLRRMQLVSCARTVVITTLSIMLRLRHESDC
jgi:hypothetical protein